MQYILFIVNNKWAVRGEVLIVAPLSLYWDFSVLVIIALCSFIFRSRPYSDPELFIHGILCHCVNAAAVAIRFSVLRPGKVVKFDTAATLGRDGGHKTNSTPDPSANRSDLACMSKRIYKMAERDSENTHQLFRIAGSLCYSRLYHKGVGLFLMKQCTLANQFKIMAPLSRLVFIE